MIVAQRTYQAQHEHDQDPVDQVLQSLLAIQ